MTFPRGGSEYGGFPGLVQPEPHEPDEWEQASAAIGTDPADPDSSVETVIEERRKQGRGRLGS